MIQTINVAPSGGSKAYTIKITDEDVINLASDLKNQIGERKCLYVVSKKVYQLYAEVLGLISQNVFILKDGENQKNFKNYQKILAYATKLNLTRNDVFVAIGGGVVGDIAGFAASTYMRGINYIQVPTTLLSMVDSSVGGKTAINMDGAKNIVGTFWQPEAVFVNVNFLKTLDEKQYKSGLGEVLKYGFIETDCGYQPNQYLLEYLVLGYKKLLTKDTITLVRVIFGCLNLKSSVINVDEKEGGLRKILNFGHTLGHALETITNYRKYTHGQAVVYGMFFIFEWAYSQNLIAYSYYKMVMDLFAKYEFRNIDVASKYDANALVEIMRNDKKAENGKITFILPCDKKKVKEIKLSPKEVLKMFK